MQVTFENVTLLKEVAEMIADLNYLDAASLLHAVSEAIRQGYTLGSALEALGVEIRGITNGGYGLLLTIKDVCDDRELINLASACTAHMTRSYQTM